tara:strand:+ start:24195 stop:24875 length:681 start_codon:yes stop_codon:yes gene_type:complete
LKTVKSPLSTLGNQINTIGGREAHQLAEIQMNNVTLAIGHLANTPRQFELLSNIQRAWEDKGMSLPDYRKKIFSLSNIYNDCMTPPLTGLVDALLKQIPTIEEHQHNPLEVYVLRGLSKLDVAPLFWCGQERPVVTVPAELKRLPENMWLVAYADRFNAAPLNEHRSRSFYAMTPAMVMGLRNDVVADMASQYMTNDTMQSTCPSFYQVLQLIPCSISQSEALLTG